MRDTRQGDVVLGDDWTDPEGAEAIVARKLNARARGKSGRSSSLARKIVTFNLLALMILVAGVLFFNSSRDSLISQRTAALVTQTELIADALAAAGAVAEGQETGAGTAAETTDSYGDTLTNIRFENGLDVRIFGPSGTLLAHSEASPELPSDQSPTVISDFLDMVWGGLLKIVGQNREPATPETLEEEARAIAANAQAGTITQSLTDNAGRLTFLVATPVQDGSAPPVIVTVTSDADDLEALVRIGREQILQMFIIALLVSIGLSLVLASTIANPLADLAAAAEVGRVSNRNGMGSARIRIPDLTARPDEIGRLSGALRGMVSALYDRIDSNEQFAADVAHEIKNPLASLRSAVGTMRLAKRDDQREQLLDVIDHDVLRLDRLVSDISNASRLDSELVREDEVPFNLIDLLNNIGTHLGEQAKESGVEFISDLPQDPVIITGLEARLAQVFVNLISNAISFCEDGDAIRLWARRKDQRVLVVVEDTGPGIPEEALAKIFQRFYSQRPAGQFGNNSGLGLAISKQIVEAHGGVIWAENIRPADADTSSPPLGARFVVGLPV